MEHGYWGPAFDDDAVEKALQTYKIRYTRLSDTARTAAQRGIDTGYQTPARDKQSDGKS